MLAGDRVQRRLKNEESKVKRDSALLLSYKHSYHKTDIIQGCETLIFSVIYFEN